MTLLAKTNNDWWSIRQANGNEGYVPANYIKMHQPKVSPTGPPAQGKHHWPTGMYSGDCGCCTCGTEVSRMVTTGECLVQNDQPLSHKLVLS